MRAHVIENGIVKNTIVVESFDLTSNLIDAEVHGGGIGWLWDGQTLTAPALTPPTIKEQIATLEAQVTERRYREAVLGTDNGWLADIDAQIAALRAQL